MRARWPLRPSASSRPPRRRFVGAVPPGRNGPPARAPNSAPVQHQPRADRANTFRRSEEAPRRGLPLALRALQTRAAPAPRRREEAKQVTVSGSPAWRNSESGSRISAHAPTSPSESAVDTPARGTVAAPKVGPDPSSVPATPSVPSQPVAQYLLRPRREVPRIHAYGAEWVLEMGIRLRSTTSCISRA